MKVLKFGGSSVRDARAFREVAEIVRGYPRPALVVLSATEGTTNALLKMISLAAAGRKKQYTELRRETEKRHREIIRDLGLETDTALGKEIDSHFFKLEILLKGIYYLQEASPRARDAVTARGELLSTLIFAGHLNQLKVENHWLDVRKIMITDNQFGKAVPQIKEIRKRALREILPLQAEGVVITQGFIGSTRGKLTTTLGRGGSDFSAALLGSVMNAEAIEIWTDVSGIMTADPRVIPQAFTQRDLSFKEAAELAYFGARVLHPDTITPAVEKKIPVLVKNTRDPGDPGTTITSHCLRPGVIKAIAFRKDIIVLTIESTRMLLAYGFLERIFDVFARHKISVDLVSTSEISVSLTIDKGQFAEEMVKELREFSRVKISRQMGIISLVSENIRESRDFLKKLFDVLETSQVEMISFGASNVNLSIVTHESLLMETVTKLHRSFFEKGR